MPVHPTNGNPKLSRSHSSTGQIQNSGEGHSSRPSLPEDSSTSRTPRPAQGENLEHPLGSATTKLPEGSLRRQDSETSNSSSFYGSAHGSETPSSQYLSAESSPSRTPPHAHDNNQDEYVSLAHLLANDTPSAENSGNRPNPVATDVSDVSIPSRFFASENGSSNPMQIRVTGHDAIENLSWFDRTKLELDRTRLEVARQSLDQGAQALEVSKKSLKLSKAAFGTSLALGAAGLIMAGVSMSQKSDGQPADNSSAG